MLRKGSRQCIQVGNASTVFWADKPNPFEDDFAGFFDEPPKDDPDRSTPKRAYIEVGDEPGIEMDRGVRIERALPLYCERYGLTGKADLVEFLPDGTPYPVEYKYGNRHARLHDDLQLAVQQWIDGGGSTHFPPVGICSMFMTQE